MSMSPDSRREHPNTYLVQDRSNQEEMQRLQIQDRLLNAAMGGLLPEQTSPERFTSVLDVGCGTGGWLIEMAKTYPQMTRLIGVDPSGKMLDFAREQAAAEGVADRVEFHLMDALRMLEFPNGFFDLVNQRLGMSWLRTWDWPKLLQEYLRITRPKGVIRITESDIGQIQEDDTSSVAQFYALAIQAFYQAGHFFRPTSDGLTFKLASLLAQHGVHNVQTRAFMVETRADTPEGRLLADNAKYFFRTARPFLQKWIRLPANYDELHQEMLAQMSQPDFITRLGYLTAWGTKH